MSALEAIPREPMADDQTNVTDVFAAFRKGDAGAVAEVRDWVRQVASHPAWRLSDVDSIVQDVLVKILDIARGDRFEHRSSFRTFAVSVARHTCIDAYRKERWRERMEGRSASDPDETAMAGNPETHHYMKERRELLAYVYQKLPEECRRLWRWVYGQGLAARLVAEHLGISEENVRVRVHRCLQKARGLASEYLGEGGLTR